MHTNGTPPRDKLGPVPGTNRPFLFNSTVKSPFCPVCPWDGWGFVPGTIVPQGPSQKCLCVFCLLVFFGPQILPIEDLRRPWKHRDWQGNSLPCVWLSWFWARISTTRGKNNLKYQTDKVVDGQGIRVLHYILRGLREGLSRIRCHKNL